jgi:flagellar motor switch protein FliM
VPAAAADLSGVPTTPLSPGRSGGAALSGGLVTDGRAPKAYDFLRPSKVAREHQRALQTVADEFAHRLGILLTTRLRVMCRVEPASIEQVSVGDHLASLTDPVIIVPMSLEPLGGIGMFEMRLVTAMTCLDHMLGGKGGVQPERPLSSIETPLLRGLMTDALSELGLAFADVVTIRPVLGQFEYNPQLTQLAQLGGATEALIVGTYDLTVGESTSLLTLVLPLQSVLPAMQRHLDQISVGAGERAARQAARDLLTARLREVPIDVTVVFTPVRLLSDQLLDLRPGDVVPLDHPVDVPLDITAAGEVFGRAIATKRGHRLACQVVATDDTAYHRGADA